MSIERPTVGVQHPSGQDPASVEALPVEHEHVVYRDRPSAAPGMALGGLGLGLIFLGGCFTFGTVMLNLNTETDWSRPGTWVLLCAIGTLGALCYLGALVMLALSAKSLLRAARG